MSPSDTSVKNVIIMNSSTAEKFLKLEGYQELKISLEKGADYNGVKSQLESKIKDYRDISFKNYKDELENVKKKYLQLSMIMYSFVLVVGIVSIVNLVNIMSMNIILRKKEIGMLRSLGFGKDEVRKMVITEGMFYGINSSIWGTGLGTILSYLLFRVARRALGASMTWSLPASNMLIMFAAALILCILASMNATRKVFSSGIVESIRVLE
jgi:ABC-type antimicrobial peptide transport system permease subunit